MTSQHLRLYLKTLAKWEFFFLYFRDNSLFHIADNFISPWETAWYETWALPPNKQFSASVENMNSYGHLAVDKFSYSQFKLLKRNEEKDLNLSAHLSAFRSLPWLWYCQAIKLSTPISHRSKVLSSNLATTWYPEILWRLSIRL